MNIGDQVIYIGKGLEEVGHRHPYLYNRRVEIIAVHKGYFFDPDNSVIIYTPTEMDRRGGIDEERDMVEVRPVGDDGRLLLGSSDTQLSELRSLS